MLNLLLLTISHSQEAYATYQADMQAYEQLHPLACPTCEPRIRQIISQKDAAMRQKIWTDAYNALDLVGDDSDHGAVRLSKRSSTRSSSRSFHSPQSSRRVSNGQANPAGESLNWGTRAMTRLGMDVELCQWRLGCACWWISTVLLYASMSFRHGLLGWRWAPITSVLVHQVCVYQQWIPWWKSFRFSHNRIVGESTWIDCERCIVWIRIAMVGLHYWLCSSTTAIRSAVWGGVVGETGVRLYALSRITLVEPAPLDLNGSMTPSLPTKIDLPTLVSTLVQQRLNTMGMNNTPITWPFTLPTRLSRLFGPPSHLSSPPSKSTVVAEEMDWEPEPPRNMARMYDESTPSSPLEDWTMIKKGLHTSLAPSHHPTRGDDRPLKGQTLQVQGRRRRLPGLPSVHESLKIAYAISALLRVFSLVLLLTSTTSSSAFSTHAENSHWLLDHAPTSIECLVATSTLIMQRSAYSVGVFMPNALEMIQAHARLFWWDGLTASIRTHPPFLQWSTTFRSRTP